jgi:hypothetical protein
MRRWVRPAIRLVLVGVLVQVVTLAVRHLLGLLSGQPGRGPVRTGSFDAWPTVPGPAARTAADG